MVLVLVASSVLVVMTISSVRRGSSLAVRSVSGGGWTNKFPAARPTFDSVSELAYDVHADRTVVFGGNGFDAKETWSYDLGNNTWANMLPAAWPSGGASPLVYDSQSDRFIRFGGSVMSGGFITRSDATWAYDFESNTWTNMNPTSKPPGTFGDHAMAYDSQSDRVIWHASFLDGAQTWAYDFDTNGWTNMRPSSMPSPLQGEEAMAYDSQSDRIILFATDRFETWAYDFDGNQWTNLSPVASPALESALAMAYDSESDRAVLLGYARHVDPQGGTRLDPETWAYDFRANTWTNMILALGSWNLGPIAYDSRSDRVIQFGGPATVGYPWAYDFNANTWVNLHPSTWPAFDGLTAYDSRSDRTVLFAGGYAGGPLTETWSYDDNANVWTSVKPSSMPSQRGESAMAYDIQSDRIVLFGGSSPSGGDFADTWAYDLKSNTWTNMNPASAPSARNGHATAYDSKSDRIILFGGGGPSGVSNETWAYDFETNSWTNLNPASAPSAKLWTGMAYDAQSDRIVLFGGVVSFSPTTLSDETWTYDLDNNTWTKMKSTTKPSPRSYAETAYDTKSDRVVLFGGVRLTETETTLLSETWSYDLGNDSWLWTAAAGPRKAEISAGGMAYDSESDRIILYLYNGDGQTWAFDYNAAAFGLPPEPPTTPLLVWPIVGIVSVVAVGVVAWWFRRRRRPSARPPPSPQEPSSAEEHRP